MELIDLKNLAPSAVNRIRAEIDLPKGFPYQVAHINLENTSDPAAILKKEQESITVVTDKHSYSGEDRIFPVNQDENSVFAQHVYQDWFGHWHW